MRLKALGQWSMPERYAELDLNRPAATWRERTAEQLRRVAQRLDGRVSLAVEVKTSVALSPSEVFEVIDAGADAMSRYLEVLVTAGAIERVMQEHRPELYGLPAKVKP